MSARDLLQDMLAAGFTFDVVDGKLLVTPASALTDDMRAELRARKPELLALLADDDGAVVAQGHLPVLVSACADCLHRLRHGNCGEPVAAGLLTTEEGFGIVWPPEGHGAGCPALTSRAPSKATERPYRLSATEADTSHVEPWNDAAIGRFQSRQARIVRLGFTEWDAEGLAERLHLRDIQADDRHLCVECGHHRSGRCINHRRAGLLVPDIGPDFSALLRHCPGFKP